MKIINYKIILYECKNGHKINNIFLEDFNNTQLINESSIICNDCNNENKGSSFKKCFFKCLTCKKKCGHFIQRKAWKSLIMIKRVIFVKFIMTFIFHIVKNAD